MLYPATDLCGAPHHGLVGAPPSSDRHGTPTPHTLSGLGLWDPHPAHPDRTHISLHCLLRTPQH